MFTSEVFPLAKKSGGVVTLVGAGPGDPDLLTVKALRAIQSAEVILYDALVSHEIIELFPPRAQSIFVGKKKNAHSKTQGEINQLLLTVARKFKNVCRLKGGDAFIFGRGGEEMLFLQDAGIAVEVVPGITAAAGCSSYANIPLTHRGVSQGCTFITAHAETHLKLDWSALARLGHTLVVYMGVSKADLISSQLINSGLAPTTPTAVIENGCCPDQRIARCAIRDLPDTIKHKQFRSPALIVIGEVVNIPAQLNDVCHQVPKIQKISA